MSNTEPTSPIEGPIEDIASVWDLFTGAEVIYAYTRADALRDGLLVDATRRAAALGFQVPVALSSAVYADCVTWDARAEANKPEGTAQDTSGRLHDVLWMAFLAVARLNGAGAAHSGRVDFEVLRVPVEGPSVAPQLVNLRAVIGPGDAGEPVITILFPGEE